MRRFIAAPLALLVVLSAAFLLAPATRAEASPDPQCDALGGTYLLAPTRCEVQLSVTRSGSFTIAEPLIIKSGVTITISPVATGLALAVTGKFTMETGSQINGDSTNPGPGPNVDIVSTGDIELLGNALISLVQSGVSCTAASQPAGSISLVSTGGNVTTALPSVMRIVRPCGKGEIFVSGTTLTLDGLALSEGTTSKGPGGPITTKATCDYTLNGSLISVGRDPGADLVHVEGGCAVKIFGLVQSTGPGHSGVADNRCMPPNRPDKKSTDRACVEIWAGNSLLIDATAGGEIDADIATGGGAGGTAWIDIFARGNITIIGDTVAPFAVHANEFLAGGGKGQGNPITIKSITGSVNATGLAVQSSNTVAGGKGGLITIEAKTSVDLSDATLEAAGSTGGGAPAGGTVNVRAFNGGIVATVGSLIDVRGGKPAPDGVINLKACTPNPMVAFAPGSVSTGATVNKTEGLCGGTPLLPLEIVSGDGKSYVILPACACLAAGCPCVTDFSFVAAPKSALINGTQLTAVTQVQLSTGTCNAGAAGTQVVPISSSSNAQIVVDLTGVAAGNYKILTISGGGSCCSAAALTVP